MITVQTPEELSIVLKEKFPKVEIAIWPEEEGLPPLVSVLCLGTSETEVQYYIETQLNIPIELELELVS